MRRARNGSILDLRSTSDVYFSRPAVLAAHVTYRQSFNQLLEGNFPLLPFQKKNEQQSQHKQIIDHSSSSEGLPEVDTAGSDVTVSGCEGHGSPSLATSPLGGHMSRSIGHMMSATESRVHCRCCYLSPPAPQHIYQGVT